MAIVSFRCFDRDQIEIWFAPTKEDLSIASIKGRLYAISNTVIFNPANVIYFNIKEA